MGDTTIWDERLLKFIKEGLDEDVGDGDHTSLACILPEKVDTAKLLVKDVGVLAGMRIAEAIFKYVEEGAEFKPFMKDGDDINPGDIAFEVTCKSQSLLKAERLVLNTIQRMSGIATHSSRFALEVEGLKTQILDTRKTTPLLRFLEKEAVRIGGCTNYRDGLYDRIMIKDNHVDAAGGMRQAIERVHAYLKETGRSLEITVEVRNLVELYEVIEIGGIDRVMLDNFEVPLVREAVAIIDGRFETEASGG
ncbi:MAG: carboxylating nicotinate-nucleotide diphosphorylase, partial [Saprospiraceae bacterium]